MPNYKDKHGNLHFIEEEFENLLPAGCVRISSEEAAKIQLKVVDQNAEINAQIVAVESQQTPRRVREAALGIDNGWLSRLNEEIANLRSLIS